MFKVEYEIKESDVANSYRHLHHADSIKIFERARCDYLVHLAYPLDDLLKDGVLVVVASINVKYLRELKSGAISVVCDNTRHEGKTLKMTQTIFNQRGKPAVVAEIELACVSAQTRRAMDAPARLLEGFLRRG